MRVKYPYWLWEDYVAGMYAADGPGTIDDAMMLLSDAVVLESYMLQAVTLWPKAAAHHLTDDGMNQRAWLGWAACMLDSQVPAHLTRAAWWRLSESERQSANLCADKVIAHYQRENAEQTTLF